MALTAQQRAKLKKAGYSDANIDAYEVRKSVAPKQQEPEPQPSMPAPPPINAMSLSPDKRAMVQANPEAFNQSFDTRNLAQPESAMSRLIRQFSSAAPQVGEAIGGTVGGFLGKKVGAAGAAAGRAGGDVLAQTSQNLGGIQDEGNLEQVRNMARDAALAGATDYSASTLLGKLGNATSPLTSRIGDFVGDRLPKFLLKGNSLFRESGKTGEQAVMRSIESQIPELAGSVPKAGRELSEEAFDRIAQLPASGSKIAVNARKAVAAEVPGSLENIVQQEVKNLKSPVPDLKKYISQAVADVKTSFPGRSKQIQEAADGLIDDDTFAAKTWEQFRNVRAGLDRETGGVVTDGQAIDKQLRSRIANLMRDDLAKESKVIADVMPELHFNYRMLNSATKQGKKSSIPSKITDTLLANPILIPTVKGLKGLPGATSAVGGESARIGTRTALENLIRQLTGGDEQESLYPSQ